MKKISMLLVVFVWFGFLSSPLLHAENKKIIQQTSFMIPVTPGSYQIVEVPFFQAFPKESSYQIKVVKELPYGFQFKVGLLGKFVQKEWTIGPIPPGTSDVISLRIECPKTMDMVEQYAKVMIGSIEDSSYSATLHLYLQPVTQKKMQLNIGKKEAKINEVSTTMDAAPMINKGRTFVPFRFIGSEIGAKINYTTDPASKLVDTVTFQLGRKSIQLLIGKEAVTVKTDKETLNKVLDAAPFILGGRTLVPLRFVSEELGATITWDGKLQAIGILFPKIDSKPTDYSTIFYHEITSEELHQSIENQEKQQIIDIRKEADFKKSHIPGAINIVETELTEEVLSKAGIQKTDKIVLYCNSGLHSYPFCEHLVNLGYTNVYSLAKGIAGWSYPTEK